MDLSRSDRCSHYQASTQTVTSADLSCRSAHFISNACECEFYRVEYRHFVASFVLKVLELHNTSTLTLHFALPSDLYKDIGYVR